MTKQYLEIEDETASLLAEVYNLLISVARKHHTEPESRTNGSEKKNFSSSVRSFLVGI